MLRLDRLRSPSCKQDDSGTKASSGRPAVPTVRSGRSARPGCSIKERIPLQAGQLLTSSSQCTWAAAAPARPSCGLLLILRPEKSFHRVSQTPAALAPTPHLLTLRFSTDIRLKPQPSGRLTASVSAALCSSLAHPHVCLPVCLSLILFTGSLTLSHLVGKPHSSSHGSSPFCPIKDI